MQRSTGGSWLLHPLTLATAITLVATVTAAVLERYPGLETPALLGYLVAYGAGGWYSLREGLVALRKGQIEVDLLMVLAAAGAAFLGYWQEGAVLLFLFSLSNALQAFALDRTRRAVAALMDLHPEEAWLLRNGELVRTPVTELRIGDTVVVRPGERIPVDGQVVAGRSWVDEAAVTGEGIPVTKEPGANVYAGTVNHSGVLEVRVLREAGDTVLARIVRLVEQARNEKAATQERIEGWEQRYARWVIGATALAALIPLIAGVPVETAVYRALTFMVVASPCAVAIAAPAAFLSALSAAARSGVLCKGGRYLERIAEVNIVAIDKTGTLTLGQPQVVAIIPTPGRTPEEVLETAAAVEAVAEHPFAHAIMREAARRGLSPAPAEHVQALPGQGVEGHVNGRRIRVGRPDLFVGDSPSAQWLRLYSERLRRHGQTVVWVGQEEPIGLIALRDTIRPEAAAAMRELRHAGVRVVMLTGDHEAVARAVAERVGIDEVHAELLPEQKVAKIEQLTREGTVAMVGDGINDAPALARAHVGIAMGGVGSDVALESADVVLVRDELERLPYLLALGRRVHRTVVQSLAFAVGVIAVLALGTWSGHVGLSLGVVGHEGSTLIVVANGLRLLFATKGAPAAKAGERRPAAAVSRLDAA